MDENMNPHEYMHKFYHADEQASPPAGKQAGKHVLIPDEIEDENFDIMSGMDKLISYVTNKIQNAHIYIRLIRTDASRFQAEFVAMASINGKGYTATYSTPGYAIGMNNDQVAREGDLIIEGLAQMLARRCFVEETPHIPTDAILTFLYQDKW